MEGQKITFDRKNVILSKCYSTYRKGWPGHFRSLCGLRVGRPWRRVSFKAHKNLFSDNANSKEMLNGKPPKSSWIVYRDNIWKHAFKTVIMSIGVTIFNKVHICSLQKNFFEYWRKNLIFKRVFRNFSVKTHFLLTKCLHRICNFS